MPLSLPLLLPALAAACLLPVAPASAGDLWGDATAEQRPAHATRAERIRAVADADRAARPEPARRGSFVIVDGPSVSSFGGVHPRGGLHERVRGTATLRFEDRSSRFGSFGDDVIVRGNTGGLVLSAPRGVHRFDRSGRYGRDAFLSGDLDCRPSSGPFLRHRGSSSFDRGFDRFGRDAAFDRGFRRGFEAGSRGIQRWGIDRGSSIEFRFGD